MNRKVALACAVACVWAQPAIAGEQLLFGPVPEWVVTDTAVSPPATGEQAELPVRVLLIDRQTRFESDRQITYALIRYRIQSSQGLSAGNVALPWRPEFDDLTVNRLAILRGDRVIDVLASGQTFTTLRREQNLEQSVLDGVLTAHLLPEDLQVGDVVEIVTTVSSRDPVHQGHAEAFLGPLNGPMERVRMRISWPQSLPLRLERTPDLPAWKRTRTGTSTGGWESAELDLRDLRTLPLPGGAPPRYSLVKFAQASDFANWGQLAAIHAPLYEAAARIPADGALRTELETIRAASPDPLARAQAALQLVQKRVRYVALAMGEGGYVPADAATTWSRRFGDCKGKTALLLALLHELGIEAEPVLVHSQLGDWLPARLPAISAFDHVLVRARIGGQTYWLDGTRSGDTALAGLDVPFFRWGLPLSGGAAELVPMVPAPRTEPDEDIAIHFDASKGVKAPVPAQVDLVMRGDAAVEANLALGNYAGEDRQRVLRDFWHDRFDFITPEKVEAVFDEPTRTLRMALTGSAKLEWDGVWYETDETRVGYRADFKREPGPGADAAYSVPYPYFHRTRQTIDLPPGFTAQSIRSGEPVDETVAGIEYRRTTSLQGNTFTVERSERAVASEFPASQATAFEKRLRELAEKRVYLRMPDGYRGTDGDLAVAVQDMPDNTADLLSQGNMLLNAGKHSDALRLFQRASEIAPEDALAWANKAVALAWLKRRAEALDAAARAEAIDPASWAAANARGLAAEMARDVPGAVTGYSQAIQRNPGNIFALSHRAQMYAALQKVPEALADAEAVLKANPRNVTMYGLRAFILARTGKQEEAGKVAEQMLANLPGDPAAIGIAAGIYNDIGKPEEAARLTASAPGVTATPQMLLNRSRARQPSEREAMLADLDEAVSISPDYLPAYVARAQVHRSAGDAAKALADLAKALQLRPGYDEAVMMQAQVLGGLGRGEEAVGAVDAFLTVAPGDARSHLMAATMLAEAGQRERALQQADLALAAGPDLQTLIARSKLHEPTDFAARRADIEAARRLVPASSLPQISMAELLSDQGDFAGAAKVFDALLARVPNSQYYNGRGIALWRLGRRTEAERDFAAAEKAVFDASGLNDLCFVKALANVALDRALRECTKALAGVPANVPRARAAVLDSRGTVLLQLGRLDEALRDLDEALALWPEIGNSLYMRAVIRSRTGDAEGARTDLARLALLQPQLAANLARRNITPQLP